MTRQKRLPQSWSGSVPSRRGYLHSPGGDGPGLLDPSTECGRSLSPKAVVGAPVSVIAGPISRRWGFRRRIRHHLIVLFPTCDFVSPLNVFVFFLVAAYLPPLPPNWTLTRSMLSINFISVRVVNVCKVFQRSKGRNSSYRSFLESKYVLRII